MVQIPANFDQANPCIITAASSGSRGVYGAIATAGDWGLKHKCAVAYTDKGSGNGYYSMQDDKTDDINGVSGTGAALAKNAEFIPNLTAAEVTAFNAATPNRFAYKHAHSQKNPEKDWGKNTLDAIEFAFYVLNEKYGPIDSASGKHTVTIFPGSTIVIAASVSNGAGSSLAAAEQDTKGLISGVVAGEPQVQVAPAALTGVTVKRGANTVAATGKPLYDYFTIAALYQPCAALSTSANQISTVINSRATERCNSLKAANLLTANGISALADEALGKLRAAGWEADSDPFHSSHYTTGSATNAVTITYAYAYGRFSVKDNVCGFSFGATTGPGVPQAWTATSVNGLYALFGTGNGVPPSGGLVNLIENNSQGGAIREDLATSPTSGTQDYNADAVICLRNLFTGTDANATKVKAGIAEVQRTGNLRGKPAILVQGRADTLIPINHAARAYFAANQQAEGSASKVRFYEVTNAQHFDTFIPFFGGYQTRLIPLHRYVINSLDLMYAYLKNGTALPASQVVRTTPRTTANTPITPSAVPVIAAPAPNSTITFSAGTLTVPD
jgi:hydroxybutyrate-dimer hydrolase